MKTKRLIALSVSLTLTFGMVSVFSSCTKDESAGFADDVLRIASWDEYIDEGGEDSYISGSLPMYEEFEEYYNSTHEKKIRVEYVALQDNETMYNRIKMGERYDLLCPSEYMVMKLKSENYLKEFPDSFYDSTVENNYYAKGRSAYMQSVLDSVNIGTYCAGYMWGTTGFVFNPETVAREDVESWNVFRDKKYYMNITAKDNTRDTYFAGLGMHYESELLALGERYKKEEITRDEYKTELSRMMNDTSAETMSEVKNDLIDLRKNLYGLETDEGKTDVMAGRIDISYQWSGDAVFIIDGATEYDVALEYCIPKAGSNLWFDGWSMMEGTKNAEAAMEFINFVSRPENVIRNMYYIGYTSCIVGDEIFDYVVENYGAEEDDETAIEYDLSYFFGTEGDYTFYAPEEAINSTLLAQYPDEETVDRCAVMLFFAPEANRRANLMWINIK